MRILDLEYIAKQLNTRGIHAAVEMTGGNVASLLFGARVPHRDYHDVTVEPLIAGPGWFEGPHWTDARAASAEFSVSRYDVEDDSMFDPPLPGSGWVCPYDATNEHVVSALTAIHAVYCAGEKNEPPRN